MSATKESKNYVLMKTVTKAGMCDFVDYVPIGRNNRPVSGTSKNDQTRKWMWFISNKSITKEDNENDCNYVRDFSKIIMFLYC